MGKPYHHRALTLGILILFLTIGAQAQVRKVKGRVYEKETALPLPFAVVACTNVSEEYFTTTDDSGYYSMEVHAAADSIYCSYSGFKRLSFKLSQESGITIDFPLEYAEEVIFSVIRPFENPAFPIIRQAVENKKSNNPNSIEAYQYKAYTRISLHIDELDSSFRDKKLNQNIVRIYDSLNVKNDASTSSKLPVYFSESISKVYKENKPDHSKEFIEATKVSGVGVEDGSLTSQLIGSTFQQYNFYENYVTILLKDFISPISDGWNTFYSYELIDSMYVDDDWCYQIRFEPKQSQDLAFKGQMWISEKRYALKKIEAKVGKETNINFVDSILIIQRQDSIMGRYLPVENHITLNLGDIGKRTPGFFATFHSINSKYLLNNRKEARFYDQLIELNEDALTKEDSYWHKERSIPLSQEDSLTYQIIDSVKNEKFVKTWVEIAYIATTGNIECGPVDIGSLYLAYAWNTIENNRFRFGLKTNEHFSKKWILGGYAAYGFGDDKAKYQGEIQYILSRKPWTTITLGHQYDIEQVRVNSEVLEQGNNFIFNAFTKWMTLRGPYYLKSNYLKIHYALRKDLSVKFIGRTRDFQAAYAFGYYANPESNDGIIKDQYNVTELITDIHWAKDEIWLQNDNSRISMGTKGWPIFDFRYTFGVPNFLGSDNFNYHKVRLGIKDNFRLGVFGRSYVDWTLGHAFNPLPYPLLENHIGNETYFYSTAAFNTMNFFEFVSSSFFSVSWRHYMDGFVTNRLPLLKKLKWRTFITTNWVWGTLSKDNLAYVAPTDPYGNIALQPGILNNTPFGEVGYGLENIAKFLRVDFIHRLTYLDSPGIQKFTIKFSATLSL